MAQLGFNYSRQGSTNACSIPSRPRRLVSRLLRSLLHHLRQASLQLGHSLGSIRRAMASRSTRPRRSLRELSRSSSNNTHGNRCPCSKRNSEAIQAKKVVDWLNSH